MEFLGGIIFTIICLYMMNGYQKEKKDIERTRLNIERTRLTCEEARHTQDENLTKACKDELKNIKSNPKEKAK
ncbi:MAG: hypothetical protein ACXX52_02780 [Candidatus Liberibacter asiaticus]|uniref:Uncharacterized protein n=2 Tax=Liberibacter asiaticus TaxID=34021 RepID=C6XFL2_LIBAP|nr:hypothetical protein [Candidatus Liberibacter asiaticus]ACT57165.1 hypothetical protein CLIBASIA_02895 [Candidatus Liberibacter asiaticus str. psy62]AGH16872.1 hypothetical protein WSI_02510 [Candidatus Liberibacter asiaticus str. gxpsy]BAP26393.1 hypothetical protein CGUJ_02895 [Candidatus Liberibacter asiaticus str. Ishi-1]ALK07227.1 hypothetical protein CD16_02545 [Candidatus Liberibacter asiaticus]ASK52711.1 hypothetical protein B2I23_02585 [Candidatus Liberibacter asiaticus]